MAFYRGQKVVFVGSNERRFWMRVRRLIYPYVDPIVGGIYTVANVYIHDVGDLMVELVEYESGGDKWAPGWTSDCFRPVVERKTDIGVFHEILRKVTRRQGADA